jgi:putative transposase
LSLTSAYSPRTEVWLYHVFSLSLRDVELLLAERGIVASYETVRRWRRKFGRTFSDRCAAAGQATNGTSTRCSSGPGCAALSVARRGSARRRSRRPRSAAARCQSCKGFLQTFAESLSICPTRVIVTDKLRSYGVAQRQLLPRGEHRRSRYSNNRAANPHRPTRRRERQVQ